MTYGPIKLTGDASAFGYGSDISVEITGLGSKPLPVLQDGYLKYDSTLGSWQLNTSAAEAQYTSVLPLDNMDVGNVQLALENLDNRIQNYAGISVFPSFVDNGNGSVTIGQGTYNLYSSITGETLLKQYVIAGDTFTLTDGVISYIYADYNSGSPALLVTTDRNVLADAMLCDKTVVFTILRQGTTIHKIPWGLSAVGAAEKLVDKSIDTIRFQRSGYSGLELTSPNLVFSVAAGKVWYGVNRLTLDTFTSNVNTTLQHVFNGTSWSTTPVTQLNNTQYQGPTGLVTADNNKYIINWIFRSISNPDTCGIVLGTKSYTLLEATSAVMPPLPDYIERLWMYIGRVIIAKDSTTPSIINSAFDREYTSAMQIINHGDLQGRDEIDQHPASSISYIPDGTLLVTATNIQDAFDELNTTLVSSVYEAGDAKYHKLHGLYFENGQYEVTLSYDLNTRTLSIIPTGSSFRVWIKGVQYTFTGTQTIQHAATGGGWYLYCNASGQLVSSQTPWSILDHAPIAFVYYDATTPDYKLLDERHHYNSDKEWHQSQHWALGTYVKKATDFILGNYTLNLGTDAATTWSLSSGTVVDEDINITLTTTADGVSYENWYKINTGTWKRNTQAFPFLYSTIVQYNRWNGSSWVLTDVTNNYYVNYYIFGINSYDTTKGIVVIPGQSIYSSLSGAESENVGSLDLTDMFSQEFVPIYKITIMAKTSNSNTGKCQLAAVSRLTNSRSSLALAGAAPTNHSSLSGREALDQHPVSAITFAATDNTNLVGISSIDHLTTLNLGSTTANTINLGTATTTQTVNIGTGTGTTTINVGAHGDTINIGVGASPNVTTINLGSSGDTVNIAGTLTYVNTTNLEVTDKTIIINKGGTTASAGNSGISVEENGTLTSSLSINANRDSWVLKAPLNPGTISLKPSTASYDAIINPTVLTANRTYTLPNKTGTVALTSDLGTFTSAIQTTTSNTISSVTDIDSFAANTYRTAEYLISIAYGTSYHATKILVVHDGTTVYLTEYGTIRTGASLATFDAVIETGNLVLKATPTNSNTTIKIFRTAIVV